MIKTNVLFAFLGVFMACLDLRDFLAELDQAGELHRVATEVDPLLEIASITDRVSKSASGGKALLFERVQGSRVPVVTNLFGSARRMAMALGIPELNLLSTRIEELLQQISVGSLSDLSSVLTGWDGYASYKPIEAASAPCQEEIEQLPDLGKYPILKNWPSDGNSESTGRFITLPLVFTCDPATGAANCGMYRCEIFNHDIIGIHWRGGSGGARHYKNYLESGKRMPVAIAIGGPPAATWAAGASLPDDVDEMWFAGFLLQRPVEMVRCRTSDLLVPAGSEIIVEGFVEPGETLPGGIFGNHTGYYSLAGAVAQLKVTCITRRHDAIYPATVVGRPPMEDCWLAKATERILLPLIRLNLPEIININFPFEGIFHNCALVAINKTYPGQAKKVVEALWQERWFSKSRLLVMVDRDVVVDDPSLVAWKVLNNVVWQRDLLIDSAQSGGDFAGGRLGVDATRKFPDEGVSGEWPVECRRELAIDELVSRRWSEYGF